MNKRRTKIATNKICGVANSYSINHMFVDSNIYTSLLGGVLSHAFL